MKSAGNFYLIFGLVLLLSPAAHGAPTAPRAIPGGYQSGGVARVFVAREPFTYFGEVAATEQTAGRESRSVGIGSYYQVGETLKLGLLFNRTFGLRHDEDWVSDNGKWSWVDSRHRGESLFALDATVKSLVDFMPGHDWVAELKLRYILNAFNNDRTLFLRPGLTYFYLREGQLIANFFTQFEVDMPLNYGSQKFVEKWIYFGSLYHVCEKLDVGPTVTLGWQTWSRPQAYAAKGGAPYSITTQSTTIGFSLILHL